MKQNPYVAGNPVGDSPAFIGRADVLREVLRVLRRPKDNAILLYGQRRIGKTSILQELAAWLPRKGAYRPVYYDLQDKATLPLAQVVEELAVRVAGELGLPPPNSWGEAAPRAFRNDFLPHVLERLPADTSLVFLFDEFDVLDNPAEARAGATFFPYLRDLLSLSPQRLQFIFVIGRRPEDLSSLTLSVFKGVKSYAVSLLSPEDTIELVRLADRNGSLHWTDAAAAQVQALTGGHPFLTQQLCQVVWERAYQDEPEEAPTIEPADVEGAVDSALREATSSLEWLWNGLGPAERVVASALAEAGPQAITQDEINRRLSESGVRLILGEIQDAPGVLQEWDLIEPTDGGYRFRAELLRRWVADRKKLARVWQEIDRILPVAENLFRAAEGLYQQEGGMERAIPLLRQAIGLNPNHLRANQLLAEILLAQGQVAEARQRLESLYEYQPAAARPRLVQALLLQAQAASGEADQLTLYEQVLGLDPSQPEAVAGRRRIWEGRGDAARAAGNLEEALRAYRQVGLTEKAESVEADLRRRRFEAGLQEALALDREGKYLAALDLARRLHDEFPEERDKLPDLELLERKTHLDSLYRKALAALEDGDRQAAQEPLAQVIALEPGYREATRYLHLAVTGVDVTELQDQLKQEKVSQQPKMLGQEEKTSPKVTAEDFLESPEKIEPIKKQPAALSKGKEKAEVAARQQTVNPRPLWSAPIFTKEEVETTASMPRLNPWVQAMNRVFENVGPIVGPLFIYLLLVPAILVLGVSIGVMMDDGKGAGGLIGLLFSLIIIAGIDKLRKS